MFKFDINILFEKNSYDGILIVTKELKPITLKFFNTQWGD